MVAVYWAFTIGRPSGSLPKAPIIAQVRAYQRFISVHDSATPDLSLPRRPTSPRLFRQLRACEMSFGSHCDSLWDSSVTLLQPSGNQTAAWRRVCISMCGGSAADPLPPDCSWLLMTLWNCCHLPWDVLPTLGNHTVRCAVCGNRCGNCIPPCLS